MSCEPKQENRSSVGRIIHLAREWMQYLAVKVQRVFKHHVPDSVDYAIAASLQRSFHAPRDQIEKHHARCGCTLICSGKTSVDQAGRFNSSLTRYVGLLATYVPLHGRALQSRFPSWPSLSAIADRQRLRNSS
jgi:hypothetical protein